MKTILFLIFLGCVLLGGYYSGLQQRVKVQAELEAALAQSAEQPVNRSLAFAISVATEEKMRRDGRRHVSGVSDISVLNQALDRTTMSEHEADLAKVLGSDEGSAKLRRFLTADRHEGEVPGAHLLVARYLDELKEDPKAGLNTLEGALDRIPATGFPLERASLLLTMNDVVEKSDQIKARSLTELTQNITPARPDPQAATTPEEVDSALSTTAEMMLPIVAHQVFLKNTTDSGEALSGTIDGISAQPDPGVRIAIASQFLGAYPDLRNDLISSLNAKGIDSPVSALPSGP